MPSERRAGLREKGDLVDLEAFIVLIQWLDMGNRAVVLRK
jgi:hypothetical protein